MNVGLCTISNKEWDVEDVVALAGEVGFDGVEIWGQDHVGDGSPETCAQIVDAADDAGVDIHVYGSYIRAADEVDEDPGDDPDGTLDESEIDHELAIADRLGADLIRIWAGRGNYVDVTEAYFDAVAGDVERIGERAEDYGVDVTIEKHNNTVTNDLEGARRLIQEVDRDNVRLNYQPSSRFDADVLEAETVELGPLANHMHVSRLEDDNYDVESIVDGMVDAGYDEHVNLEFASDERPYEEAVEAEYDILRSVVDGL